MAQKITKKIVVFYDGADCPDGFGGGWAAWKKFGKKAEYIKAFRFVPAPNLKDKEIYMIDFTYPEKTVRKMIKENKSVTALDHHATAKKTIKLTKNYSYSSNHSGCVLAWKHFFPKKPVPMLLKYIEGGDLWKFGLPHAKKILLYIRLFDFDFKTWNKLANELKNPQKRKEFAKKGSALLFYQDKIIKDIVETHEELARFEGHKTIAVNSPRLFRSEIGTLIARKMPPFGIVWNRRDGKISVSLRSVGKFDVSKIAKKFGGGGHRNMAGFTLDGNDKLPWKYIKQKLK